MVNLANAPGTSHWTVISPWLFGLPPHAPREKRVRADFSRASYVLADERQRNVMLRSTAVCARRGRCTATCLCSSQEECGETNSESWTTSSLKMYTSYMDDIFNSKTDLNSFNSTRPAACLTTELEIYDFLSFLGVRLRRKEDKIVERSIFRKRV